MLLVPFLRGLARPFRLFAFALTVATTAFAQTQSPSAADGFDPNIDGIVLALAVQRNDGKIIAAGAFQYARPDGHVGVVRNNIARFNPDGTLDFGFDPNANGIVRSVAVDGSRRILIGGDFTQVGGKPRAGVARLNEDGSVDDTFTGGVGPNPDFPATPQVFAVLAHPDGSVIAGGTFGLATSAGATAIPRNNLVRFSSTGVVDPNWDPNPNAIVLALAMHTNNRLLIGGAFTELKENGRTTATSRLRMARLENSGVADATFDVKANDGVASFAVQPDGKIVVGGHFTTLHALGSANADSRSRIGRLNADGTMDTEFFPTFGGAVLSLAVGPDGGIVAGGRFRQIFGRGNVTPVAPSPYVVRLFQDGTPDESFNPGVNGEVAAVAYQSDGKVLVGGYFTTALPLQSPNVVSRNHIARVLPNGALDASFDQVPAGRVLTSVTQADGKVVVGGSFTSIGGQTRYYVARLNPDGTVDPAYHPRVNGPVYAMAYDAATNKVVIGGDFTGLGPTADFSERYNLARLNPDGTVDSEFNVRVGGTIATIAVTDAGILVGGSFSAVQVFGSADPVQRSNLMRLTPTGQLDTGFNPLTNGAVTGVAVQSDKKIVVVGHFTQMRPNNTGEVATRNFIARINSDGTLDKDYRPITDAPVSVVALQADGKAIIGGQFRRFSSDDGLTGSFREFLARINPDGKLDDSFYPKPNDFVMTLAVQADKKILIGGAFTTLQPKDQEQPTLARYAARLNENGTVDTTWNLDLNERPGNRVNHIAILGGPDASPIKGDVLVSGRFASTQPPGSPTRVIRNQLALIDNATGGLVSNFDPRPSGTAAANVRAISLQPDTKVLVGGTFTDLGGASSTNLARYNAEGTPDYNFNLALATDGPVNAIAVRPTSGTTSTHATGLAWLENSGRLRSSFKPSQINLRGRVNAVLELPNNGGVIIGGVFTDVTNTTRPNLIKLRADGTVDPSFSIAIGGIWGILLSPDGTKIIVYGNFTTVGTTSQPYIARLNLADGSLDTTFRPKPSATVLTAVQFADGSVAFGGSFQTVNVGETDASAVARNYAARVTAGGGLDDKFNPNFNGPVYAMAIDDQQRLVVGGAFTTTTPPPDTTATTRNRIARFNADGSLDKTFDPSFNEDVFALAIQPDDKKIVVGGEFTAVGPNSTAHRNLARIDANGAVDETFKAGTNLPVASLSIAADGDILAGGYFTTVNGSTSTDQVARSAVARFERSGDIDLSFNPNFGGFVTSIRPAADGSVFVTGTFTTINALGQVIIGGEFSTIGGVAQKFVAQLNGDGSVDASFNPALNGRVNALLPMTDGRLLVAGAFTTVAGAARPGLARFNADGSLDAGFSPTFTGEVASIARQADGRILVGVAGATGLIRLNADGSTDGSFQAGAPFAPAVAIAVQRDGNILVAGPGSGIPPRVLRLTPSGAVDPSFTAAAVEGGLINTLTLQSDGAVIVAGSFARIGGQSVARLARLTSTGAVDPNFAPAPDGSVDALALQTDGRLLIGGSFLNVGGLQRPGLARLGTSGASTESIGVSSDGSTVTWLRSGSSAEIIGVIFQTSSDGRTWSEQTWTGTRLGNGSSWQATNVTGLTGGNRFVRARGIVPTSAGKSTGVYELVQLVNTASPLTTVSSVVGRVASASVWDSTHYVWTQDASGVLRIKDVFTAVSYDGAGTVLIDGGRVGGVPSAEPTKLANLSTRGRVGPQAPLIGGFALTGTGPRSVLIRAAGPALAPYEVPNYLRRPELILYRGSTEIARATDWDAGLKSTFVRVGAFPFAEGSTDAAFVVTLDPGTYTVQVADRDGASGGETLVEIYDTGALDDATSRLVNLSTRATVSAGTTLIGGLYVNGTSARTLLVRGIGPSLTRHGVAGALTDPRLAVYDGSGRLVATNNDWSVSEVPMIPELDYAAAVAAAAREVWAFALDTGSKDAGLIITLPAGAYTVQLTGAAGESGAGMIEVYELP